MFLLALLLPGVYLIITGRIFRGIICILLQLTLFGWILAAWWAIHIRNKANLLASEEGGLGDDGSTAVRAAGVAALATQTSSSRANEDIDDSGESIDDNTEEVTDGTDDSDDGDDGGDDGDDEGGLLGSFFDDD